MLQFFPSRAVALLIGPVAVHWYGILYVIGFLIGIGLLPRLLRYRNLSLTHSELESLFITVFLGVILGGRLGFVLFYGGNFYLQNPVEILAVWHGGMSSHGGFLGVLLMLLWFTSKHRIPFFRLMDVLVIPIAIGLALGRIGNLINGELYGTITTLPWGMHFPAVEGLRHPTQLYAVLKDLLIALVCFLHLKQYSVRSGQTTALFLMMYAVLRFAVEIFRDQPYGYTPIFGVLLSRGQLLTIPLFLAGSLIWFVRSRFETH